MTPPESSALPHVLPEASAPPDVLPGSPALPHVLAVVVARGGVLPLGADEAVAEAGGAVLVTGSGTERAAASLPAYRAWTCETGEGFRPGALARALAPLLTDTPLVLLPASPDGRDLAPRLAAELNRPLLAECVRLSYRIPPDGPGVRAELSRLDGRVVVPVTGPGSVVATLLPGVRSVEPAREPATPVPITLVLPEARPDTELIEILEPLPDTMDLAEAPRVVGAGAGLVPPGMPDHEARDLLDLLGRVGGELGASMGATRVVTDTGRLGHERQIGTTGVAVDPELYLAFGVSGASQHTGGLGSPRHVVSVNTDPSCPMTAMADLGLVTDARELLLELARRLGADTPADTAQESTDD